jgi:hypothetical protein
MPIIFIHFGGRIIWQLCVHLFFTRGKISSFWFPVDYETYSVFFVILAFWWCLFLHSLQLNTGTCNLSLPFFSQNAEFWAMYLHGWSHCCIMGVSSSYICVPDREWWRPYSYCRYKKWHSNASIFLFSSKCWIWPLSLSVSLSVSLSFYIYI